MRPVAASLRLVALLLALASAGGAAAAPLAMVEIAPGIYVHAGAPEQANPGNDDAIANIGFIIGDDAVMVIDPGGSAVEGEQLHAAVRAVTGRPIRYVVLTHVHPDHIFGAVAFRADHPEFIGHARLPGALAQRGDYYVKTLSRDLGAAASGSEIVAPTHLVAAEEAIDRGNRVVDIRAHGPAHTDNDLTLFDRRTATLWLSDLLFVERIPVIDGSIVGWIKEIGAMTHVAAQRAVPGHGPAIVDWPAAAEPELRYLNTVLAGTRAAIRQDIDIAEAPRHVALDERDKWLLFDDCHARNVTAAYKELEWE
ncbi:MAG TPA: quinoprotein relay system zinc metallohydrolase 2 [Stellaceae bacterium]|nr:quinoprotein relay system zinc metallohydrolase 2 [Stellaceae bacterium]